MKAVSCVSGVGVAGGPPFRLLLAKGVTDNRRSFRQHNNSRNNTLPLCKIFPTESSVSWDPIDQGARYSGYHLSRFGPHQTSLGPISLSPPKMGPHMVPAAAE